MVGEFPELQGVMGGYYARAQGENDAVADAVRDHYKPVGQGDDVPTAPVTVAVSLADKLDTLVGFFAAEERPTGSKDPFALRRATAGVIIEIVTNGIRMPLMAVFQYAWEIVDLDIVRLWKKTVSGTSARSVARMQRVGFEGLIVRQILELFDFFADRLKVQQREAGVRHDLIDAVFALGGEDDLVRLLARVKALQAFVGTDEGANLLAGYKRAANILKQLPAPPSGGEGQRRGATQGEGGVDALSYSPLSPDPSPPEGGEGGDVETDLLNALDVAEPKAVAAIESEDFEGAMAALASLRVPIDAFFEGVMVNDPDSQKRAFRLGLLARFRDAVHRVADFSRIEG